MVGRCDKDHACWQDLVFRLSAQVQNLYYPSKSIWQGGGGRKGRIRTRIRLNKWGRVCLPYGLLDLSFFLSREGRKTR